jgi:hypothetical protein
MTDQLEPGRAPAREPGGDNTAGNDAVAALPSQARDAIHHKTGTTAPLQSTPRLEALRLRFSELYPLPEGLPTDMRQLIEKIGRAGMTKS